MERCKNTHPPLVADAGKGSIYELGLIDGPDAIVDSGTLAPNQMR